MTPTILAPGAAAPAGAARTGGDAASFFATYNRHLSALPATPGAPAADTATGAALLAPLSALNDGQGALARFADKLSGGGFTPGEVLELSLQTHEFVFRCQLTATIANRSGDGVQQLFRQQA